MMRAMWLRRALPSVVSAILLYAGSAEATDPMSGVRSLAMGGSLRGLPSGAEGLLINPAGIATTKQFSATGFYSLRVQSMGHFLHASTSDSLTNPYFALGLYYNFVHESPHYAYRLGEYTALEGGSLRRVVAVDGASIVRTGSEAGTVIAVPLFSRFALGGTLKYGYYTLRSTPTPQQLPPDYSYVTPNVDGDRVVDLGSINHVVTFDLGATLRIIDELYLGVVGHNLWGHGFELPSRLGLGLGYRLGERLTLAFDAVIDFTSAQRCTQEAQPSQPAAGNPMLADSLCVSSEPDLSYRLGGGVEYVLMSKIPLRLGYLFDSQLSAHHLSGGIGYYNLEHNFGLDFSLRQGVNAGAETVLLLGLRILRN